MTVFPLRSGTKSLAPAKLLALRARATRNRNGCDGLILLKNSRLIEV